MYTYWSVHFGCCYKVIGSKETDTNSQVPSGWFSSSQSAAVEKESLLGENLQKIDPPFHESIYIFQSAKKAC